LVESKQNSEEKLSSTQKLVDEKREIGSEIAKTQVLLQAKKDSELNKLLDNIRLIKGVEETETFVVLDEIKY